MVEVLENIQQWFAEFLSYRIWATDFFRLSVKSLLQVLLLLASARYGFWLLNRIIMRSKAGEHYDEGRPMDESSADARVERAIETALA